MLDRNHMPLQQGQPPRSFQAGVPPPAAYAALNRGPPPRRFAGGRPSLPPPQIRGAGGGAPFSEAQLQMREAQMREAQQLQMREAQQLQMQEAQLRAGELPPMRGELPPMRGEVPMNAAELQMRRELPIRGSDIHPASIRAEMQARASLSPMMNRQFPRAGLAQALSPQQQASLAASIPLRESLVHNVRNPTLEDMRAVELARAKMALAAAAGAPIPRGSPNKAASLQDAASALLTMGSVIKQSEDSDDQPQDSQDEEDSKGGKKTKPFPTRLALPEDEDKLNSMHCFLRAELLEVFLVEDAPKPPPKPKAPENSIEALEAELTHSPPPNSAPNRIGIRCVHCSAARKIYGQECEAPMAVFYPKSLAELYRLVTSWQRVHLRKCRNLPKNVRDTYQTLRATDKTRGKTHYWVTSAKKIGLKDSKRRGGGVVFDP